MEARATLGPLIGSMFDSFPEGIAIFDRAGKLVWCNRAALQTTNYESVDDVAGVHFSRSIFRPDRDRVQEAFDAALEGAVEHFQSFVLISGGGMTPVELLFFPLLEQGRVQAVATLMRDALLPQTTEDFLTQSQQRFRSLFEYHPDAIAVLKLDGSISRVNVALETLTGTFGEHLIGKPWLDLLSPAFHAAATSAFAAACEGNAGAFDGYLLARDAQTVEVQINLVPLRVADTVEGAYLIAKDVSAQRDAERAVILQGERIRELYLAASARGVSVEAQIDNTLALGCRLFQFDQGYVTRYDGSNLAILNAVGEGAGVTTGQVFELGKSLSRHLRDGRTSLFIPDLDSPRWRDDPARQTAPWRSYCAAKLEVGGVDFGALVFAGRSQHETMSDLDRDLLHLMALFVAAALERAQYAQTIEHMAFYDSLTGLPNRVLFNDRIRQAIGAAKRYGHGFAVMYLDLDEFKSINDSYGHGEGDLVLKAVAMRLLHALRESDTLARFGGDEFVVLQPVVDAASESGDLAQKLVAALREPVETQGRRHVVKASVGVALYPADGSTSAELMEASDRALYEAKRSGRNTWKFSSLPQETAVPRKK